MTEAPETPSLSEDSALNFHAGGAWRNKADIPARITPRPSESVSGAIGSCAALWLVAALSTACMAAEATPVAPQRTPAPAPSPAPVAAAAPATPVDSANPPPPEKHWPPKVEMLSPSHSLNRKSRVSVNLVHRWQDRNVNPSMGPRGEVRFIYGATQDTVVCAPLRLCDIALQPGEIVKNVNLGDPVMWSCPPAISGSGAAEVTHLMCKPADAGLETSLAIQTTRRTYSINLVSHRTDYMPLVGWTYPEDQAAQWAAYQLQAGGGEGHSTIPAADGSIRYDISGDNPPWRPIVAYSDGHKTYIQFPPSMAYGKAPALERLP